MITTNLKIGDTIYFSYLERMLTLERIVNQGIVDDSNIIFIETICKDHLGLVYLCDCDMVPVDKGYSSLEELADVHGKKGITELNDLQLLAKELYFKNVGAKEYQNIFEKKLKSGIPVFDLREEGYYCCYCESFSKKPIAFEKKDNVIFVNNAAAQQIWIVNEHYDGCRGWE